MIPGRAFYRSAVVALGLVIVVTSVVSDTQRSNDSTPIAAPANTGTRYADPAPATQSARENRRAAEPAANKRLTHFLLLGIAINVIVLVLFGAWFIAQWRKSSSRQRSRSPRQ